MGNSGKPLTQNKLARMLKPLGIIPEDIWIGSSNGRALKGYVFAHFDEAFSRYLPPEGGSQPRGREEADEMGTSSVFKPRGTEVNLAVEKCKKPNNDGPPRTSRLEKGGAGTEMRPGGAGTEMRPDPDDDAASKGKLPPAGNGRAAPGAFMDAQGKPTDDPELGYYGRAARAPLDAAYQATTEKQPVEKAPPAQPDQPVSTPDPVPARPVLEGDRRREAIRARNQEALRRLEAEIRERPH
jgi:hypothetical protein